MYQKSIVCCYLYVITKYGYPPPAEDTLQHLQEIKNLGFSSLELEGIRREHLLGVFDLREKLVEKIKSLNLKVPYFCIVLPGLSAEDEHERLKNLELFEKGCEIATAIESIGVLDNAPLPPYHFPQNIPLVRHYDEEVLQAAKLSKNINWKKYWNGLIATYQQACEIAAAKKLTYHLHPCLGVMANSAESFLRFYDTVGRDNLRFTLDTANQYYLKENLLLALHSLSGLIDYIHLSDNRGKQVEHIMPGTGKIDWSGFFETLETLGFSGHIGLDIGGDESGVKDIDKAYVDAAKWVEERWNL